MDRTNASSSTRKIKLKDSCDVCSASKVRCTKEKPVCKRCEKFGYHCLYSPARRVGRPYRPCSTQSPVITTQDSNSPPKYDVTNAPITSQQPWLSPIATDISIEEVPDSISGSSEDPTPIISNSITASSIGSIDSGASRTTSHVDCACVGLDIIYNLMSSSRELYDKNQSSLANVKSSLSTAKKLLCRILICPCSQNLDVALLLAAIFNMMLDLIESLGQKIRAKDQLVSGNEQVTQELRDVTALVLQFSNRYAILEGEEMVTAFPSLVLSIRSRLHDTIDGAMGFPE